MITEQKNCLNQPFCHVQKQLTILHKVSVFFNIQRFIAAAVFAEAL